MIWESVLIRFTQSKMCILFAQETQLRPNFNLIRGEISFNKCNETHSHNLSLSGEDLSRVVKDLAQSHKRSRVPEIKKLFREKKINGTLDCILFIRNSEELTWDLRAKMQRLWLLSSKKEKLFSSYNRSSKFSCKNTILHSSMNAKNFELFGDILSIDEEMTRKCTNKLFILELQSSGNLSCLCNLIDDFLKINAINSHYCIQRMNGLTLNFSSSIH